MTAYPAINTTSMIRPQKDPKGKARVLRRRLLKGLDLILEAEAAGNQEKAASLQVLYDRLEIEYREAVKIYSETPEDLLRCPDCPYLGKGPLYEMGEALVICDSPCKDT